MAHLVRLNILVDDENEASVCDGINEMLRVAQQPVEEDGKSWIVDWALDNVRPTLTELDDSIVNETYAEGDFIRDWVAFSEAQAKCSPEDGNLGFWSNEYGWTTLDLATKFDGSFHEIQKIDNQDVIWKLAPYNHAV
jgi:hypothetical protein